MIGKFAEDRHSQKSRELRRKPTDCAAKTTALNRHAASARDLPVCFRGEHSKTLNEGRNLLACIPRLAEMARTPKVILSRPYKVVMISQWNAAAPAAIG